MDLQSQTVLLTGASKGIGRALARVLAEDGARLLLAARSAPLLEGLRDELAAAGAEVSCVAGDVGRDEDVRRMVEAAEVAFGRIDVLVNNAAVLPEPARIVDIPAAVWEDTLRINVVGTVNCIRHVLPGMEARRRGLIVNLSSGWGRTADADVAPYCASKFAVEAITQSLAKETGRGVTVFALNPGVIATEMLARAFGGDVSAYPSAADAAPRWRRLFRDVSPSWHGTSRNL